MRNNDSPVNDYLLTIAQKIIYKSAPMEIIKKYQQLKRSLVYKMDIQEIKSSQFLRPSHQAGVSEALSRKLFSTEKKPRAISKTTYNSSKKESTSSHGMRGSSCKKIIRCNSNYSENINNIQSNKSESQFKTPHSQTVDSHEYKYLLELSLLLKNAERFPRVLQKIEFPDHLEINIPRRVKELTTSITSSLRAICQSFDDEIQKKRKQQTLEFEVSLPKKPLEEKKTENLSEKVEGHNIELKKDNKWLIQKLQCLIQENAILRKMVGKQNKGD